MKTIPTRLSAAAAACLLAACGGGGGADATDTNSTLSSASATEQAQHASGRRCGRGDDDAHERGRAAAACAEEARPHDTRVFTVAPAGPAAPPFDAMPGATVETDRWWGTLGGAGYRVEVPKNWNGRLVMYAHGYAGTGEFLGISNPSIRRHLIENGYAWAASSYRANYYDVRAGVEDTNALALAFNRIAADNGRELKKPRRTYIIGHSMGGHIVGAAIDREAQRTAVNRMRYDGAVPMCGVMGDTELFDYFGAYQLAAQQLAGVPATAFPTTDWATLAPQVTGALFTRFSTVPTPAGMKLREVVKNLTGGERPVFSEGFANTGLQAVVWSTFGGDGTINGILTGNVLDTRGITYQLDADPSLTPEEQALNAAIVDSTPVAGANRLRRDGLRWIPRVNGQFDIPVVSLHTLGDLYVPFKMEQIFRQRANASGSGRWLVQRAVRAPSHCDFTVAEQVAAFDDMVKWEETGRKPAGDDVLNPHTVADSQYGCRFTNNSGGVDDSPVVVGTRALMPACSGQ